MTTDPTQHNGTPRRPDTENAIPGIGTACVRGAFEPDAATGAVQTPIYASTAFQFEDADHAADLFALRRFGNIYSRIANPTCTALEERLCVLENGAAAIGLSSGQQATLYSLLAVAQAGQNFLASTSLYGGTWALFAQTMARFGIEVRFFDPADPGAIARLADAETRAVYAETIGNPKNDVADIEALADAAHGVGVPLIIDNTCGTPALVRPIDHGADVVVHSLTKFINGHGSHVGGAVIDGGRFDWTREPHRWPEFTAPDHAYNGIILTEHLKDVGNIAYLVRIRTHLQRDLGGTLSPFAAFLFLQGLESLHVRMQRHCDNALAVALHLERHPAVAWVNYPGLPSHPSHETARRYLRGGFGAIVGFGLRAETPEAAYEAGKTVINELKLFSHVANIGDAKSLSIHPASTTHSQLTVDEMRRSGVSPEYVRLSVGLEDAADLVADLDRALAAAVAVPA